MPSDLVKYPQKYFIIRRKNCRSFGGQMKPLAFDGNVIGSFASSVQKSESIERKIVTSLPKCVDCAVKRSVLQQSSPSTVFGTCHGKGEVSLLGQIKERFSSITVPVLSKRRWIIIRRINIQMTMLQICPTFIIIRSISMTP